MEDKTSTMSRHTKTTSDQDEESSWTMYFEDFFSEIQSKNGGNNDDRHDHENSSLISDAASFVGMKKIIVRDHEEPYSSSKKRRNRQVPVSVPDLEDTASSPSRSPNVYSMMNLLDNNTRHENVGGDTNNEKGNSSSRQDGESLSLDLKKKGLCVVPLSMVADYLG